MDLSHIHLAVFTIFLKTIKLGKKNLIINSNYISVERSHTAPSELKFSDLKHTQFYV